MGDEVMSEVHSGLSSHDVSRLSIFTIAASPLTSENDYKCQFVREQCTLDGSMKHKSTTVADAHGVMNSSMPDENRVTVDESGDLVIPRRTKSQMHDVETKEGTISLYHRVKTTIPYVGLQIWKASLLLGDYLLHKMHTTGELDDVIGLELGTGTDAFFNLLEKLMPSGSQTLLWLALEKRFNFSLSDLDVVAHGYEHFLSFLEDRTPGSPSAHMLQDDKSHKIFAGKLLHFNQIPQYIREYERTNDLELWEIWRI